MKYEELIPNSMKADVFRVLASTNHYMTETNQNQKKANTAGNYHMHEINTKIMKNKVKVNARTKTSRTLQIKFSSFYQRERSFH